ncbi:MAG: hypothetical protein QUS08_02755 [Methanothrix sp.]|nr:hypothetical protein [Methanothrix sp.]
MIVRILGEGQFRLDDGLMRDLDEIDNRIVDHVQSGNHQAFRRDMHRLISLIRERGEPLDPLEIVQSSIIAPHEDISLEEAKKIFFGSGIIEG